MTSDIAWSGADCTPGVTPRQLVQSSSENDTLFDRIEIGRNVDDDFRQIDDRGLGNLPPARKFSDYVVRIDRDGLPEGVEILDLL